MSHGGDHTTIMREQSHDNGGGMMMMHGMVFQNTRKATLLFPGWSASGGVSYGWLCIISFIAGILAVVFKFLRNEMENRLFLMTERKKYERLKIKYLAYMIANCFRAIAVFIMLTWDYFLMLGAMTFNVGIFFSIVSGVACGFLFMGHLFISPAHNTSSESSISSEHKLMSCRYPQRIDVACSPQLASMEGSESLPQSIHPRLLTPSRDQNCSCSV